MRFKTADQAKEFADSLTKLEVEMVFLAMCNRRREDARVVAAELADKIPGELASLWAKRPKAHAIIEIRRHFQGDQTLVACEMLFELCVKAYGDGQKGSCALCRQRPKVGRDFCQECGRIKRGDQIHEPRQYRSG